MRNCRNRKVNRVILCSRKQGSAPAGNTIEKANRDERYASLLASMQNRYSKKPDPARRHHQSLPGRRKHEFLGGVSRMGEVLRVGEIGHGRATRIELEAFRR